jgi:hypothetical protein
MLFLESRVMNLATGSDGYVQTRLQPSGGFTAANDSSDNSFFREGAIYNEANTNPNYFVTTANSYGPNFLLSVNSPSLIYADLMVQGKGVLRVNTGVSFSSGITLPRFVNGDRVLEASILVEGEVPVGAGAPAGTPTGTSPHALQRLKIRFLPESAVMLAAYYVSSSGTSYAGTAYPGQSIQVHCPAYATYYSVQLTPKFMFGSSTFSGTVVTSTGNISAVGGFSPSSIGGGTGYPYRNIDNASAVKNGTWTLVCLY